MKGRVVISLWLIFLNQVFAASFDELLAKLEKHDLIQARLNKVKAMQEGARRLGSWGDPKLSVAALNFPKHNLKRDQSMMTGVQLGISQTLSLSGKYRKIEESQLELSKSALANTLQLRRKFAKMLWSMAIDKERLVEEEKILRDNLTWLEDNLKVTKRLYATGKVPLQAVLDIQIRKSELSAQIDQINYALESFRFQLSSLLNHESDDVLDLNLETMPWSYLSSWKKSKVENDFEEQALKHYLKASELKVTAQNRDYIPDVTVGLNYTKRNDIDSIGDFVGAKISFPLPTSDSRYAAKSAAIYEKREAENSYRSYKIRRPNRLKKIESEINNLSNQLKIIKQDTLKFAKSSRDITAKSYSRGGADYVELLRAELQYQNQRLKRIKLVSELKEKEIEYLFVKGDDLKLGSHI